MPSNQEHRTAASLLPQWEGAGLFNLYFLLKFALAYLGYLNLHVAANALLFVFVLIPIGLPFLRRVRKVIAWGCAFTLIWSESWLPGPDVILQNARNLSDFSAAYLWELVSTSINFEMLVWFAVAFVSWLFLRHWIRFSTLTVFGLVIAAFPQILQWGTSSDKSTEVSSSAENIKISVAQPVTSTVAQNASALQPPQPSTGNASDINSWLEQFFAYEKGRKVNFPPGPVGTETSGTFDIAIVNICSLSNDDIHAAGLDSHPVFKLFDARFENFSSATSYSGPATLRLLTSGCGQISHKDIYNGRRPECEVLNRLQSAGWTNRLYMDHDGHFDDYLQSLRTLAGLTPELHSQREMHKLYEAFDGAPIFNTTDVFNTWFSELSNNNSRSVSFFNLVALHDGNRDPGSQKPLDFKLRAERMLNELQAIMEKISKSGRPLLFIVVPEHGAAYRGDKIQMARLREIPSPHITHVPVMVKFFGIKTRMSGRIVSDPVSYLAVSEIINRTINSGLYLPNNQNAPVIVSDILRDLPQTWSVSENANARVVHFANDYWVSLKGSNTWIKYPQK